MRVAECSLSLAGRFACSYAGCRGATGLWSLLLNYVAVNQADSEESEDGEGRGRAAPTNPPRGFILYLIVKGAAEAVVNTPTGSQDLVKHNK